MSPRFSRPSAKAVAARRSRSTQLVLAYAHERAECERLTSDLAAAAQRNLALDLEVEALHEALADFATAQRTALAKEEALIRRIAMLLRHLERLARLAESEGCASTSAQSHQLLATRRQQELTAWHQARLAARAQARLAEQTQAASEPERADEGGADGWRAGGQVDEGTGHGLGEEADGPPPLWPAADGHAGDADGREQAAAACGKAHFRLLARRYHPDLAATDAQRQEHGVLMVHINGLYRRRDWARLAVLAEGGPHEQQTLALAQQQAARDGHRGGDEGRDAWQVRLADKRRGLAWHAELQTSLLQERASLHDSALFALYVAAQKQARWRPQDRFATVRAAAKERARSLLGRVPPAAQALEDSMARALSKRRRHNKAIVAVAVDGPAFAQANKPAAALGFDANVGPARGSVAAGAKSLAQAHAAALTGPTGPAPTASSNQRIARRAAGVLAPAQAAGDALALCHEGDHEFGLAFLGLGLRAEKPRRMHRRFAQQAEELAALAEREPALLRLVFFAYVAGLGRYPLDAVASYAALECRFAALAAHDHTVRTLAESLVQGDALVAYRLQHDERGRPQQVRFDLCDASLREAMPAVLQQAPARRLFAQVLSTLGETLYCRRCQQTGFAVPLFCLRGLDNLRAIHCAHCQAVASRYVLACGDDVPAVLNRAFVDMDLVAEITLAFGRHTVDVQMLPEQRDVCTVRALAERLAADLFGRNGLGIKASELVILQHGRPLAAKQQLGVLASSAFVLRLCGRHSGRDQAVIDALRVAVRTRYQPSSA